MESFIPLILFILLCIVVLVLTELRERRKSKTDTQQQVERPQRPEACCGEHLVCERETLLQTSDEIVYYDDEELDELADLDPQTYTEQQSAMLRHVFDTLPEADVVGWCRSLQLRRIQLPSDIKDEALMIVREQRNKQAQ